MGSLHLDPEEEPRRGASRANSVRFDEKAIHGHFGQSSRSANDFLPSRTGSAFGTHPLGERSLSHKSEGRQSSTHSARASSIGNESRPLSATVAAFAPNVLPTGPPSGLFILDPVPSIIRCWLDTKYSNDSLLYAAVCTGSYKSTVAQRLLEKLDFTDRISTTRDGARTIKLPVYLPEATIQQSSSRSTSPAPQLPTLTTEFLVQDIPLHVNSLEIFLGCDVLRFRSADIHFSLDRLTLFDDDRNKLSVPLVRPENAVLFQDLQTIAYHPSAFHYQMPQNEKLSLKIHKHSNQSSLGDRTAEPVLVGSNDEHLDKPPSPEIFLPSVIGDNKKPKNEQSKFHDVVAAEKPNVDGKEEEKLMNGTTPDTPSRADNGSIWSSWRRESTSGTRGEGTFASAASASGYQRASRGRGMKVLKPARLNTSRTSSSPQRVGFDALGPRGGEVLKTGSVRKENHSPSTNNDRRTFTNEPKPPLSSKPSTSNPIGGASAFPWLNTNQKE